MLQDDLVVFLEAGENFYFAAVRDASLHGDLTTASFAFGVRNLDGGGTVFVKVDCLLRDGENVLMFFKQDLCVGGHVGFEFAAGIVNGDTDFKGGDVIFFNAERSDTRDATDESLVAERLHADAGLLTHVDLADIGFINFALDVDLVDIADGHDECGGGTEDEDGGDGVAFFNVAREDDAIHGGGNCGVGELLFKLAE